MYRYTYSIDNITYSYRYSDSQCYIETYSICAFSIRIFDGFFSFNFNSDLREHDLYNLIHCLHTHIFRYLMPFYQLLCDSQSK